jgi:uncharacterized protein (DUF1015 family)
MQQLRPHRRIERRGVRFDEAQPEVDVAEQLPLLGLREVRSGTELRRAADVGAQPRVQLRSLAAERRDADGVLEQSAGVAVVAVRRRRQRAEQAPYLRVVEEARDRRVQAGMRDLRGEEVEEPVELVRIAPDRRCERDRIRLRRGLEVSHLELQAVAEALDAPEHVHRVAFGEPRVEQIDVVPDPRVDASARIDELEREVRCAVASPQLPLTRDCVYAFDHSLFGEIRNRAHGGRLTAVADVRPFRALRYEEAKAGPLSTLVAPPYDVISPEERQEYLARSPYNVVHLTLPDTEETAARDLHEWRDTGVLVRDDEPVFWALSQTYTGPDAVERTRNGHVVALRLEPYDRGIVLPHERTHAGPKEGRLRLLRATRTQLEPIFLLHDGERADIPDGEPDLQVGGDRLWRVGEGPDVRELQLLIADGHHRYETALAFHEEDGTEASAWMMVVLVSTREEGLTIFPTHRIAQHVDGVRGTPIEEPGDELPGVVLYRAGRYELLDGDGLDVEIVDRLAPEGVSYTPNRAEAVATVDRGAAEAAFLLRPTRIEDVFAVARRGEVMPQKSTYFFPKLTSGLLLYPLD